MFQPITFHTLTAMMLGMARLGSPSQSMPLMPMASSAFEITPYSGSNNWIQIIATATIEVTTGT